MPVLKKIPFPAYCLLLTTYLLISCHADNPAEKRSYGDTIIKGGFQKLSPINPLLSISSESSDLEPLIFDGLIKIDEKGEPQSNLSSSWDISEDGLIWRFYLRKGIRFHDEIELTAEDVIFTYGIIKNHERYSNFFEIVKDMGAVNKYTVEITLKKPYVPFLYGLEVGILPKHKFNQHPIGTGPYKVDKWSEDEIILKANERYFNGRPYLNRIIIKSFPNQKVIWARLMRGEIDFSREITPSDYEIIKNIPSFKTYSALKPYYYMIAFNMSRAKALPYNDKQVRKALNYAVDKEKIINKVLKGMGKVSAGTIYPLSWAYYHDIKHYPYNPRKALELLKEAGWEDTDNNHILDKNGKELIFTLLINKGDKIKERCAMLIQEQLLDIGIKLQIEFLDLTSMSKRCLQREFESAFIEIISKADPDINYRFWHSSQIDRGLNIFSYKNQRLDELLDKGRATFDKEKRKEYYIDFQKEMLDDPPGIFLFWTEYLVGIHERFKDVKVDWRGTFANITEWYVPEKKQKYK
ncbi:MAG: hypothetical protein HY096_15390 [Nitrospinae bacterium]|nr:hypothetical protein [Nitrospinota bacterium]